jgi:hypothetical protein
MKGRWKRRGGSKTPYALSLPLTPRTSAGWPLTCVFVTVNEARRYLATSILSRPGGQQIRFLHPCHLKTEVERTCETLWFFKTPRQWIKSKITILHSPECCLLKTVRICMHTHTTLHECPRWCGVLWNVELKMSRHVRNVDKYWTRLYFSTLH